MAVFQWGSGDFIEFDASVDEGINLSSDITDDPVEEGSNITDHSRRKNPTIKLNVIVTNTPIRFPGSFADDTEEKKVEIETPGGNGVVVESDRKFDRVKAVYDQLVLLKDNATRLTVLLGDKFLFQEMLIADIDVNRNATTGSFLSANLMLKEVRIVNTRTTDAPLPRPREQRAEPTNNQGNQPAKPEPRTSVLSNIASALRR